MKISRLIIINIIPLKAGLISNCRKNQRYDEYAARSKISCGRYGQRGLTLLELIIVIAIIGILSGIAIPFYFGQIEKARVIKAVAELDHLQLEIENFELDNNRLPGSLEEATSREVTDPWGNSYRYLNFETLEDDPEEDKEIPGLDKKSKGKAKGKGKKDKSKAENSIRLDQLDEPLNSDYDLYSCGTDGKSAPSIDDPLSQDDIVRGRDGAYLGLAPQFEP
jgi:general secretion pathway protein G